MSPAVAPASGETCSVTARHPHALVQKKIPFSGTTCISTHCWLCTWAQRDAFGALPKYPFHFFRTIPRLLAMSEKPPYVVLDSNVWVKELALQSAKASAVRYYLKTSDAKLVVPRVVRLEVEEHLRQRMIDCRNDIERAHRELLFLMGTQRGIILPTDDEIEAIVPTLIDKTGVDILNIPLTLDAAESSFARIRRKRPPSHNKEQFADGVIWENCVKLLDEASVCLVTADSAFFKGNDLNTGQLAPTLLDEVRDRKNRITIYRDLERLMENIRTEISLDNDDLIDEARTLAAVDIQELLDEHQFSLGPAEVLQCKAFITEKPDELYVQFTAVWQPLFDEMREDRRDGRLTVVAEGTFLMIGLFSKRHLNKVALDYTDTNGLPVHCGTINVRALAATFGGPATEKHTLRLNPQDI